MVRLERCVFVEYVFIKQELDFNMYLCFYIGIVLRFFIYAYSFIEKIINLGLF